MTIRKASLGKPPSHRRKPARGKGLHISPRKGPPPRPCKRCNGTGCEPRADGECCILCDGHGDL